MKQISKLTLVLFAAALLFSCKKEVTINNFDNCKMVSVQFEPKNLLLTSDISLRASVSKDDAEGFQFSATKPTTYYAYFIVGNEVIHKFDQLIEGAQTIQIQERPYDKIIVSSIELSNNVLRNYNNNPENLQKLVHDLPTTSEDLILAGEIYDFDVRQSKNITIVAKNYYAAVIFFNADIAKTQDNISFFNYSTPVVHHFLYVKDRNLNLTSLEWSQGFRYEVNNTLFNYSHGLEVNRVYKFFIERNNYGSTDGNFTIVVEDLFTKPVDWKGLPGRK